MKVLELPIAEANNKQPEIVFAVYQVRRRPLIFSPQPTTYIHTYLSSQCMFAALVPAIVLGAAAERSRFLPSLVFTFLSVLFSSSHLIFGD